MNFRGPSIPVAAYFEGYYTRQKFIRGYWYGASMRHFFDRYGQALVFLVHVFLDSETRHPVLTVVLSDFAGFCRGEHNAKTCQALHIKRIESLSSRSDHGMP